MLKMKVYGYDFHYFSQQVGCQRLNHERAPFPFCDLNVAWPGLKSCSYSNLSLKSDKINQFLLANDKHKIFRTQTTFPAADNFVSKVKSTISVISKPQSKTRKKVKFSRLGQFRWWNSNPHFLSRFFPRAVEFKFQFYIGQKDWTREQN